MFGLVKLMHEVDPETTLEKIAFLLEYTWSHYNRLTTLVSFGALFSLIAIRAIRNQFKRYWFIYRIPEVLVVVIISTSKLFQWSAQHIQTYFPSFERPLWVGQGGSGYPRISIGYDGRVFLCLPI